MPTIAALVQQRATIPALGHDRLGALLTAAGVSVAAAPRSAGKAAKWVDVHLATIASDATLLDAAAQLTQMLGTSEALAEEARLLLRRLRRVRKKFLRASSLACKLATAAAGGVVDSQQATKAAQCGILAQQLWEVLRLIGEV